MSFSDSDQDSDNDQEIQSGERGKMSDLLASYYGISPAGDTSEDHGDVVETEDHSPSAIDDVAQWQIDSTAFDATQYARHLLYTASVESLLAKDDELVHEVKALDSDMQMLVYENYNKFIAATETIRKMKHNVDSMDAEMDTLVGNMATIADCSEVVNASLADKRSQIDKLVRVRRLLKRLEFLFDLPSRLARSIEMQAYSQAVRYYSMTKDILHNYSHVPSFRNIEVASSDIMGKLRCDLLNSLEQLEDVGALTEHARLLLELEELPGSLLPPVVTCLQRLLTTLLDEVSVKELEDDDLHSRMRRLSEALLPPFLESLQNLNELFGCGATTSSQKNETSFEDYVTQLTEAAFGKYFGMVESLIDQHLKDALIVSDDLADESEDAPLVRALKGLTVGLDHHLLAASVLSRATALVKRTVNRRIEQVFLALRQKHLKLLLALHSAIEAKGDVTDLSLSRNEVEEPLAERDDDTDSISSWICALEQSLRSALQFVAPFVQLTQSDVGAGETTVSPLWAFVATQVWLFLRSLNDSIETLVGCTFRYDQKRVSTSAYSTTCSPTHTSAQLSKVQGSSTLMEEEVVDGVGEQGEGTLRKEVVSPKAVLKFAVVAEKITTERAPDSLMPKEEVKSALLKHAQDAAGRLAAHYVELHAQDLVPLIEYDGNFSGGDEVPSVRPEVLQIVRRLSHVVEEATEVLGPQPPTNNQASNGLKHRGNELRRPSSLLAHKGLQLDIARIFTTRVQVFGDVSLSVESILLGILKAALKAMIESVRSSRLTSEAYRQVQVDAQLLRQMVPYLLADCSVADTMFDEVLVSAMERCLDPDGLDATEVLSVVAKAQSQLAAESS